LCRENPYAANAVEAFVSSAVGAGIKPSSLLTDAAVKAEVRAAWLQWTDESDADGLTDFYGLQALAVRALFEAGECFVRFRPRRAEDGLSVPLQLQILEAEHLPFHHNEQAANGNVIRAGIEFDGIGRRVAYHFLRNHPGEAALNFAGLDKTVVPASEVMHLYRPLRPGQIRGQPAIVPGMIRLYLLDQYDDAELDRKRVAAMFAGFVTKPRPEDGSPVPLDTHRADQEGQPLPPEVALAGLEPGTLQVLLEGEDIKFSNPSEVGDRTKRSCIARCLPSPRRWPAIPRDHCRRRQVELLELACLAGRSSTPDGSVPAHDAGVPNVQADLATMARNRAAVRPAVGVSVASLSRRSLCLRCGEVNPAEVGMGRSVEGSQGRRARPGQRLEVAIRHH
jgi:hypothetical protein